MGVDISPLTHYTMIMNTTIMQPLKGVIHSPDDIISPRAYAKASFQTMPDFVTRHGSKGVYFEYNDWSGNVETDLTTGDIRNVTLVDEAPYASLDDEFPF